MTATSGPDPQGQHLATIGHEGRFWDVYLEFEDDLRDPECARARLAFNPADPAEDEEPYRTAVIIIEDGFEAANRKARALEDHQLVALLRSVLP